MMKSKIKNSIEYKTIQMVIGLLEKTPFEIENRTKGIVSLQLQTRPDPDSWSAVEILAHLHACATIWGKSIEKMLQENDPIINDTHPRKWEKLSEFSVMSFEEPFHKFTCHRKNLISRLITLSVDDWEKGGWIKDKKHTVFSQARRMALHEFDHLDQLEIIVKILNEKEMGNFPSYHD